MKSQINAITLKILQTNQNTRQAKKQNKKQKSNNQKSPEANEKK